MFSEPERKAMAQVSLRQWLTGKRLDNVGFPALDEIDLQEARAFYVALSAEDRTFLASYRISSL